MKNTLTLSAVVAFALFAFTSCVKNFDCACDIKTVTQDTKDTVKSTNSLRTVRATKPDAADECKYYETEESFLQRPAIVYHYCAIKEK